MSHPHLHELASTRRPDPTAPSIILQQAGERWQRWIHGLRTGPLAPLLGTDACAPALAPEWLAAVWRGAVRETSWRLLASSARERLVPAARSATALQVELGGRAIVVPLAHAGAFELDRPDLDHADDPALDDPLGLLAAVVAGERLDPRDHARVAAELLDSIVNLAQARLAGRLRSVLARLPEHADDPRVRDPEHFVSDGHPWHVMARTRLGLRRAEVVRYAPEQLATTAVACVEIALDHAQVAGAYLDEAEPVLGRAPVGFVRVPVHPAQLRRLPVLFPTQWRDGSIRRVPGVSLPGRSLLSLRTLALEDGRHLKLACDVHTTSTRRWVSPMSVHNGPPLTELIHTIQADDPITAALQLLAEPGAAGLDPARLGDRAGQLGAIFRVGPRLAGDEQAWVCAAVGERWPGTEARVLERAAEGYPGGLRARLDALVDDWIARLVPPALRLFVGYGIALELHLQNTLVRVADGRVRGFCVRDLGGIRIHGPSLAAAGLARVPQLAPGSFILTDDLDEVRGKLEHTLFHAQFGHLLAVVRELGGDDERGWARLRDCVTATLNTWAADPSARPQLRDRARVERDALTRPRVRAKALLRMRLRERSSEYDYTEVANALAR